MIRVKRVTPTVEHVFQDRWRAGRLKFRESPYAGVAGHIDFECKRRVFDICKPNGISLAEAKQQRIASWRLPEDVMELLRERQVEHVSILLLAPIRKLYVTHIDCWIDHAIRRESNSGRSTWWYLTFNYFKVVSHVSNVPFDPWE